MGRRPTAKPAAAPAGETLKQLPPGFAEPLLSMYEGRPQRGDDGQMHKIDTITNIIPSEGMLLYSLCRKTHARDTLEVGFAHGYSTVYFMAAAAENGGSHIAIDPFESTDWQGIGFEKVRQVGMADHFTWLKDFSVHALPRLEAEGRKFDVIFIDGSHRYEDVLLDFVLSDRICKPSGYIVMDDMWLPAIRKVVDFVVKNRADYVQRSFDVRNVAVFQKIGEDKRDWRYFVNF